jgi:hypothetical protein
MLENGDGRRIRNPCENYKRKRLDFHISLAPDHEFSQGGSICDGMVPRLVVFVLSKTKTAILRRDDETQSVVTIAEVSDSNFTLTWLLIMIRQNGVRNAMGWLPRLVLR